MRGFTLLSVTLLVFVPVGSAQEKQAPRGESPKLWLASASQQDGKVIIQIAQPVEQSSAQNGPGTADVETTYFDLYNRPIWFKDADGWPVKIDMVRVRQRKRDMVEGLVALHVEKYKASGAELIMGTGRFVAPKTLQVQLNDGGTRLLTSERVFLNVGTRATIPPVPGLADARPITNIELLEIDRLPEAIAYHRVQPLHRPRHQHDGGHAEPESRGGDPFQPRRSLARRSCLAARDPRGEPGAGGRVGHTSIFLSWN